MQKEPPFCPFASDPLDLEMSLDHFLVSPQNQMAFKLCLEIERPPFNPIYLYGPKGSGKTHLLMGAAARSQKQPFFVTAETFTEHVVRAIRTGTMREFRKTYRSIDALLIDDIDLLARKSATQEEFFHTFNALHTAGKPIVLSASSPPSQLSEIEPRLMSRFEWGISIGVGKGDPAAILKKKAALWKFPLSEETASFLLLKFPSNPILALQALVLRAKEKLPLHECEIEVLLSDLLKKETATPEAIIAAVAAHFDIKNSDLLGKSQTRACAFPRQIAMYLCRERLNLPLQKIGKLFGRDHSTVITSVEQIKKGIQEKKQDLLEDLAKIERNK